MSITAMKQALEALHGFIPYLPLKDEMQCAKYDKAIKALEEALAKQEQGEPVGWPCLIAEADFSKDTVTLAMQCTDYKVSADKHWLCTTPQPAHKPLTDEEIGAILEGVNAYGTRLYTFARAIEAAHGIKS